jgi:dolichol-phosphate mannosyltransferase
MKFSILIPTYNEATSILELLESLSLLREEGVYDFDVLVIDDNSPDGTATVVENSGFPGKAAKAREERWAR